MPIPAENKMSSNINDALSDDRLKIAISSTIAVTIPILLEIFRDHALFKFSMMNYTSTFSNLILIFSIVVPNLVLILAAMPNKDVRLFVCVSQAQLCAIVTFITSYLVLFGGNYWRTKSFALLFAAGTLGNVAFTWIEFLPNPYYLIVYWIGSVFLVIGILFYSLYTAKWWWAVY